MAASYDHLRALVVEDNAHMRTLMRSLLGALGLKHIVEASDGDAGFAEFCARTPDLVLTDLSMTPTDGIDLTRKIRTSADSPNRYIPIILVTGHTERARVEAARDAGVTEFLAKPITVQNLTSRLSEIVERPRPFVRCASYFGPDRRRRRKENFSGPWRRADDLTDVEIC